MNTEDVSIKLPTKKWFNFGKLNKYELFLFICGVIGMIVIFVVSIISISLNKNWNVEVNIFNVIISISSVFCALYLSRGIFDKRPYELMAYTVASTCLLFYLIIDFIQNYPEGLKLPYVNVALAILIIPVTAVLSSMLAYNYNIRGDLIFHVVEGHERLQDDCKNVFVFEALLQLDSQFELCMIAFVFAVTINIGLVQILMLAVGVPFSIAWHIFGFLSVRKEVDGCVYLFLLLGVLQPGYACFIIYNAIGSIQNAISEPIMNPVTPVVSITFAVSVIMVILRVMLTVMTIVVCKRFGIGLKDRLNFLCCDNNVANRNKETYGETEPLLDTPNSIND